VTITETPVVARRLELAATLFPERADSRSDLLLALTEVAERALLHGDRGGQDARAAAKRRLLERTAAITARDGQDILAAREADWDGAVRR